MLRPRRFNVLGAKYSGRADPIVEGLLPVHGCPLPVFLYVALSGIGEQFVKLRGPFMRAGRMKTQGRRAFYGLNGPYVRHRGQGLRLRDLVRGGAYGPALLKVRRAGTGRQLGVPLMQIADPHVKLSGSLGPA